MKNAVLTIIFAVVLVWWFSDSDEVVKTWERHPDVVTSSVPVACDSAGYDRIMCDLVVPLGRTQDELLATAERAAHELGAQHSACGVVVRLMREGDVRGSRPGGMYSFAPDGEWSNVPRRPGACRPPYLLDVTDFQSPDLATSVYFDPPWRPEPGDWVRFTEGFEGADVKLSRTAEKWHDDEIIATVPRGKLGKVQSTVYDPVHDQDVGRIKVEFRVEGRTVRGWAHSFYVEPGPPRD